MAAQPYLGWPGIRRSYTCAEAILGANVGAGVVVERRTGTDLIGNAAVTSLVVCGVALDDVPAARASVTGKQVGDGHECTVYNKGFVNVVAAATVAEGQRLKAAANGQVTPWVSGTDSAAAIIGWADQAASANATVRIFINA